MESGFRETFDALWRKAALVDGWLTREEAAVLHALNTGAWCEVGCWRGKSTLILATQPGWAVDWFRGSPEHGGTDTYDDFMRNLAGNPHVTVIRKRFEDAADDVGAVELLHLDADHSYTATRRAFDLYSPKVKVGGHVVLHDAWGEQGERERTPWPGVTRFAGELAAAGGWVNVLNVQRSAVFQRRS